MAGGNLSPRQKMINMMYLVLTALLALNISKDILDALVKLEVGLDKSADIVKAKNDEVYAQFNAAAAENLVKAGPWRDKALAVGTMSDDLYSEFETIKEDLIGLTGGMVEKAGQMIPKGLDNREKAATYMLVEGRGKELRTKIEIHKEALKQNVKDNPIIAASIETSFNTDDISMEGKQVSWENATFEHYPLAAVLAFLTDYQARIRNSESDVIGELQKNIGKSDLKFTDVIAVSIPTSRFVTQGDEYEAEVFLAAYDKTQKPEILINGQALEASAIVEGKGTFKLPANVVGEQKWAGTIRLKQNGGMVEYPVEGLYNVSPPTAVISPTKMNVLYRNVDNPLEIGVPGYDPSKVRVTGTGVRLVSAGQYMADVSNVNGKEISINVSVESEDGTVKQMGKKTFRVKSVPSAEGSLQGQKEVLRSAGFIKNASVDARLPDFAFDLALNVTSFEIVIPGFPPEKISGNRLNAGAKALIEKTKNGATIVFRNIKASGPKGLRVKAAGFSIDVNN